eukprot:CAMPEP_0174245288 /NCGR_PEP_ID=MMETSP0417-20130205/38274_1 /TAXON_ID=242541 /ORGANISM="Mayorella sp, Strain BSH-02190019" /LENGTH=353 /DNA_ID=CAMNT_0015325051 /DNA_START=35 /DNA_END=1092 /DNA_ORIENTATION=-
MNKADEEISRLTESENCAAYVLNPYWVLQVPDPENVDHNELRRIYRKLSLLVHPDRNAANPRAPDAFDVLNKAYRQLTEGEERETCDRVLDEAVRRVNQDFAQRRKMLRDEGKPALSEEHEADLKRQALGLMLTRLFGEYAARKQRLVDLDAANRKREREQELQEQEQRKDRRTFEQQWEVTRDSRVDAWRAFSRTAKASLRESDPYLAEKQQLSASSSAPASSSAASSAQPLGELPARVRAHLAQRQHTASASSSASSAQQPPAPPSSASTATSSVSTRIPSSMQTTYAHQYVSGVAPAIQKPQHTHKEKSSSSSSKKKKKKTKQGDTSLGEVKRPKTAYFRGVRRPPRLKV